MPKIKPKKPPKVEWVESSSTLPILAPKTEVAIEGIPSWKSSNYLSNPECDFESLVKRHLLLKTQANAIESELNEVRVPLRMHMELAMAEVGLKKTDLSDKVRFQFSVGDVVIAMRKKENEKLNIDTLQHLLMVAGLDADVVAKCFKQATKSSPTYYPEIRKVKPEIPEVEEVAE